MATSLLVACGAPERAVEDGDDDGSETRTDTATVPSAEPAPTLEADSLSFEADSVSLQVSREALRLTGGREGTREVAAFEVASDSSFVAAALRPESTAADATVVAMVSGGEGYDLRWLTVDAGTAGPLRAFPDRYPVAASPREATSGGRPTVAWTPDGGSVAWLEWTKVGETVLRTVGWADGPGTGDPATDNAAFSLGPVPAGSRIEGWADERGDSWRMEIGAPDGTRWSLRVERQADGALALPGPPVREPPTGRRPPPPEPGRAG